MLGDELQQLLFPLGEHDVRVVALDHEGAECFVAQVQRNGKPVHAGGTDHVDPDRLAELDRLLGVDVDHLAGADDMGGQGVGHLFLGQFVDLLGGQVRVHTVAQEFEVDFAGIRSADCNQGVLRIHQGADYLVQRGVKGREVFGGVRDLGDVEEGGQQQFRLAQLLGLALQFGQSPTQIRQLVLDVRGQGRLLSVAWYGHLDCSEPAQSSSTRKRSAKDRV